MSWWEDLKSGFMYEKNKYENKKKYEYLKEKLDKGDFRGDLIKSSKDQDKAMKFVKIYDKLSEREKEEKNIVEIILKQIEKYESEDKSKDELISILNSLGDSKQDNYKRISIKIILNN